MAFIRGAYIDLNLGTDKFKKGLSAAERKIKTFARNIRKIDSALRVNPTSINALKLKLTELEGAANATSSRIKVLTNEINSPRTTKGKNKFKLLNAELEAMKGQYKKIQAQIFKTKLSMDRLYQSGIKFTRLGQSIDSKVRAPLFRVGLALGASLRSFKTFEESIGKVATITPEAYAQTEALRSGILDLSNATGVAAAEISEGLYQAISTGLPVTKDGAKELEYLTQATKLAVAGNAELGETITVLNGVVNSYGKEWADATDITNDFMTMIRIGKVEMSEIAQSLGNFTSIGEQAGLDFKEIAAALATATKKGIPFANAVTGLRALISQALKPTTALSQRIQELFGKSFEETLKSGVSFSEVLKAISESTGGSATQINALTGRIRAAVSIMSIFGSDGKILNETLRQFTNNAGEAGRAFEKQLKFRELQIQINKLKNSFILLGTEVFKAIGPMLSFISDLSLQLAQITPLVETLAVVLTSTFSILTVAFLGGKVLKAIGLIITTLGFLKVKLLAVKVLMVAAFKANPITAIISAVTLLLPLLAKASEYFGSWKNLIKAALSPLVKLMEFFEKIKKRLSITTPLDKQFFTPNIQGFGKAAPAIPYNYRYDVSPQELRSEFNRQYNIVINAADANAQEVANIVKEQLGAEVVGG